MFSFEGGQCHILNNVCECTAMRLHPFLREEGLITDFFFTILFQNSFVHSENAPVVCFRSTNVECLSRENNGNITMCQLQLLLSYNMLTSYISSLIINQPLQHNPLFRSHMIIVIVRLISRQTSPNQDLIWACQGQRKKAERRRKLACCRRATKTSFCWHSDGH